MKRHANGGRDSIVGPMPGRLLLLTRAYSGAGISNTRWMLCASSSTAAKTVLCAPAERYCRSRATPKWRRVLLRQQAGGGLTDGRASARSRSGSVGPMWTPSLCRRVARSSRRRFPRASRRWAEKRYTNIRHWNELEKGGHFAAFEQPGLSVDEFARSSGRFDECALVASTPGWV